MRLWMFFLCLIAIVVAQIVIRNEELREADISSEE
jgi:hypothetical protein